MLEHTFQFIVRSQQYMNAPNESFKRLFVVIQFTSKSRFARHCAWVRSAATGCVLTGHVAAPLTALFSSSSRIKAPT